MSRWMVVGWILILCSAGSTFPSVCVSWWHLAVIIRKWNIIVKQFTTDTTIYERIYIMYTTDTIYAWYTVTMERSSSEKLYLIFLWVILLIELNTCEHILELIKITITNGNFYYWKYILMALYHSEKGKKMRYLW